jgi:hypothetical protein
VSIIAAAFMSGSSAAQEAQDLRHRDPRKFLAASVKVTGQGLTEFVCRHRRERG